MMFGEKMAQNELYQKLSSSLSEKHLEILNRMVLFSHSFERTDSYPGAVVWLTKTLAEPISAKLYGLSAVKTKEELLRRVELTRKNKVMAARTIGPIQRKRIAAMVHSNNLGDFRQAHQELKKLIKVGKI